MAFAITDTKLYVPVVTLSTQDTVKLLKQSELGFNRTTNWNKYQSRVSKERSKQYLNYLIHPSFRGVNRLFALSFEDNAYQTSYKQYFLSTVKIKGYNFMIHEQNFF